MYKKIRVALAAVFWLCLAVLFLDATGFTRHWVGWMAKIQFMPACLALSAGVVAAIAVVTLLVGRIYCSVICPLGVTQDIISGIHGRLRKKNRYRFSFVPEKKAVRYTVLGIFIALLVAGAFVSGLTSVASLIEPYSAFGRMAVSLHSFRLPTFIVAAVSAVVIIAFSWHGGRAWCNTFCPVGTILGSISRYSIVAPVIDEDKCVGCGLCGKQCKSSCIDTAGHAIDTSRCVDCFDCIGACRHGAISFKARNPFAKKAATKAAVERAETAAGKEGVDTSKRAFIAAGAMVAGTALMKADGGLAPLEAKQEPVRETRITPPGSVGLRHMSDHCVGCQLCVNVCPNDVLRPSTDLDSFMQPKMGYEGGWCRPECTRCSDVCPAGAILKITKEEKTAIHIGHAVVDTWSCVTSNGEKCGNCARHCPAGAIRMVPNEFDPEGPKVPFVNEERCLGCGACEYVCPVRPLSAIHVEGNLIHHDERNS